MSKHTPERDADVVRVVQKWLASDTTLYFDVVLDNRILRYARHRCMVPSWCAINVEDQADRIDLPQPLALPKLLEALKEIARIGRTDALGGFETAYRIAEAAIREAEGKSQHDEHQTDTP